VVVICFVLVFCGFIWLSSVLYLYFVVLCGYLFCTCIMWFYVVVICFVRVFCGFMWLSFVLYLYFVVLCGCHLFSLSEPSFMHCLFFCCNAAAQRGSWPPHS
jgi:hypothetical protein